MLAEFGLDESVIIEAGAAMRRHHNLPRNAFLGIEHFEGLTITAGGNVESVNGNNILMANNINVVQWQNSGFGRPIMYGGNTDTWGDRVVHVVNSGLNHWQLMTLLNEPDQPTV